MNLLRYKITQHGIMMMNKINKKNGVWKNVKKSSIKIILKKRINQKDDEIMKKNINKTYLLNNKNGFLGCFFNENNSTKNINMGRIRKYNASGLDWITKESEKATKIISNNEFVFCETMKW